MRLSVVLLVVSLAGVLGGGWLIGLPAFGGAVIFDSLCLGVLGVLLHDFGRPPAPSVHEVPTLAQVLDRARAS